MQPLGAHEPWIPNWMIHSLGGEGPQTLSNPVGVHILNSNDTVASVTTMNETREIQVKYPSAAALTQ